MTWRTILPKALSLDLRSAKLAELNASSATSLRHRPSRAFVDITLALSPLERHIPVPSSCRQSLNRHWVERSRRSAKTSSMPDAASASCNSRIPGVSSTRQPLGIEMQLPPCCRMATFGIVFADGSRFNRLSCPPRRWSGSICPRRMTRETQWFCLAYTSLPALPLAHRLVHQESTTDTSSEIARASSTYSL